MIKTIIKDGYIHCNCILLTEEELSQRKESLRQDAMKFLNETRPEDNIDHIIYYHDERDVDNNITLAWLYYNMVGLSHETFIQRTKDLSGEIGEVHRSEYD